MLLATFLTGVFQLAMGLRRMGVLVNFISHTVVIGFTAGAGSADRRKSDPALFRHSDGARNVVRGDVQAFVTRLETRTGM